MRSLHKMMVVKVIDFQAVVEIVLQLQIEDAELVDKVVETVRQVLEAVDQAAVELIYELVEALAQAVEVVG